MINTKFKNIFLGITALLLVACGNVEQEKKTEAENAKDIETTLTVASHLPPMTDIVDIAAENIEAPYSIELLEVSDNVQYNESVQHKESYASFAQHEPFMEQYNEANDGELVAIQTVYDPIVGFYSPTYDSIDDIKPDSEIAIPNDSANEARALLILEDYDLIKLDKKVEPIDITLDDIVDNPLNLEFTSVDLLNLTAAYEDGVDLVFNYPTYIVNIDLTPDDALFLEDPDNTLFSLVVVTHKDNIDDEATKALQKAFTSKEVYDYLIELSDINHLYPAFDEPVE